MAKDPPRERPADFTHGRTESPTLHRGDSPIAQRHEPLSLLVPELSQRPVGDAVHAANHWLSSLRMPSGFPEAKVEANGIQFKDEFHSLQERVLRNQSHNDNSMQPKHGHPDTTFATHPDKADKTLAAGRHRQKTPATETHERRRRDKKTHDRHRPDTHTHDLLPPADPNNKHVRSESEWYDFYRSQTRGNNCLPTAMSMMYADLKKGAPASKRELRHIEHITHVRSHGGYAGSAQDIANQAKRVIPGLKSEAYQSLDRTSLGESLDRHLDQGHRAIVGIESPYTDGNNHYIYVAGKDSSGQYMIGDSGRHGGGVLGKTISRDDLLDRMMARNGGSRMVAGWLEQQHTDGETPLPAPVTQKDKAADQPVTTSTPKETATLPRFDIWDHIRQPGDRITTHGERQQMYVGNAVVNMPKDLDASQPIHFVTYFNGFRSSHIDGHRSADLDKTMADAPKNTVLISPRWQDVEHSEKSARHTWKKSGGLPNVLNKVFAGVPELKRSGLDPHDNIGLVGFSAGYNPVRDVLSDKSIAPRVTDIVMLDAPSSAVQRYVLNNLPAFITGDKRFTSVAGDWRNSDYHRFSRKVAAGVRHLGYNPRTHMFRGSADNYPTVEKQSLNFLYTDTPHSAIPAKHYRTVAF